MSASSSCVDGANGCTLIVRPVELLIELGARAVRTAARANILCDGRSSFNNKEKEGW